MIFSEEEIIDLIKEIYSEAYYDGYSSGFKERSIHCEREKQKILKDFIGRNQEEFLSRVNLGKAKH